MPMPSLTPEQRACILEAFTNMDQYATGDLPTEPLWEAFYYDGYVTLAGLLHVAKVITAMHLDTAPTS